MSKIEIESRETEFKIFTVDETNYIVEIRRRYSRDRNLTRCHVIVKNVE